MLILEEDIPINPFHQSSGNFREETERVKEPEDGEACWEVSSSGCDMALVLMNSLMADLVT